MTAVATHAGAFSHERLNWHAIDWRKAHHIVRRLQARIVKATKEGRWNKVKALQRLLTHSWSGKVLAVRRVTENRGKRTPGVDQVIWDTPVKKAQAVEALRQRGYHALPLRRVLIEKANGTGKRALHIPAMSDRATQALHLLALAPIAETTGDPNSYGFRVERSTADAIGQCFVVLSHADAAQWILKCDIRACFDHLGHDWLEAHILMEKAILRKWLKAGFIDKDTFHPTEEGVAQGSTCSPAIANLALDGLEQVLRQQYPKTSRLGRRAKVNMIRYGDDTVITGSSKELLEDEVLPLVKQFMGERTLELSAEKTKVAHIEEGFDFLGQNVRKYNGKLLITPAKKNVAAFLSKVRKVVKEGIGASAGRLIARLNPVIRGWANYHRHVVSKETFVKVDNAIFMALWHWAKQQHPTKNRRWIRKRYFQSFRGRNWVFFGKMIRKDGEEQDLRLFDAASVEIKRHTKIKGEANPYDPAWEVYFEERLGAKMVNDLRGWRQLYRLWQEQSGICPVCNQKITKLTGWHNHHLIWRSLGGQDRVENRVLLHPECHRQVHSQKSEVRKPRPAKGV